MSLALGQIGFFQLSNLARNKVPYALFLIEVDPPSEVQGDLALVMKSAIPTSAELLLEKIASLQLKTDHPIVLMCEQGGSSLSCSKELINRGFVNVYCVKGGWKNVLVEAGLR